MAKMYLVEARYYNHNNDDSYRCNEYNDVPICCTDNIEMFRSICEEHLKKHYPELADKEYEFPDDIREIEVCYNIPSEYRIHEIPFDGPTIKEKESS